MQLELRLKIIFFRILYDNLFLTTLKKIYVIHALCDRDIFAGVIGIPCCVIKTITQK